MAEPAAKRNRHRKKEITAIYATLPVKTAEIWHQVAGEKRHRLQGETPHPSSDPVPREGDAASRR